MHPAKLHTGLYQSLCLEQARTGSKTTVLFTYSHHLFLLAGNTVTDRVDQIAGRVMKQGLSLSRR